MPPPTYDIEVHKHRFSAWAASCAASVRGCRFGVATGRMLLERTGFDASFAAPEQLPRPDLIHTVHRHWRERLLSKAAGENVSAKLTHGVAAKLINVYLKSRFVCGGAHDHERGRALHPPIDALLLKELGDLDVGGQSLRWRVAAKRRWSKFTSEEYEEVVGLIRDALEGKPMWMKEKHWRGNQ